MAFHTWLAPKLKRRSKIRTMSQKCLDILELLLPWTSLDMDIIFDFEFYSLEGNMITRGAVVGKTGKTLVSTWLGGIECGGGAPPSRQCSDMVVLPV